MSKKLFIDSAHPEEVRVVILDNTKLEEYDYETSSKKQLKGNIYLAKITRVEPSLQAAFVDYGGGRQGFLAFSEIHPDYYRIPVDDRSHIMDPTPEIQKDLSEATDQNQHPSPQMEQHGDAYSDSTESAEFNPSETQSQFQDSTIEEFQGQILDHDYPQPIIQFVGTDEPEINAVSIPSEEVSTSSSDESDESHLDSNLSDTNFIPLEQDQPNPEEQANSESVSSEPTMIDPQNEEIFSSGDDTTPQIYERKIPLHKKYRIQEVIKKRQIVLVQVTREERGNKGAALTTYISLPGRYCVLMPNTEKDSGGISRKINDPLDRKKLKEMISDLSIEEGMSVIVRTAGSGRTKTEIKRDFEALIRLWDNIRNQTLSSTAPALVFEEGDLIRRSIRDLYTREVDDIIIEGEEGYKNAKNFMKLLIPSHAKKIQLYKDKDTPLFHKYHIEEQLASIDTPNVTLPSGGYLIINQTEALVAIDVNSGRSTRERNIEETALKTNLEAAEEVARQLRLRDLGGLIVIDFIDMDDHGNQHQVEKRLKDSVRFDRARIQIGRISQFGLLEMSRQRLRPSVLEMNSETCSHCGGHGSIRSVEARALKILRGIESEAIDYPNYEVQVILPASVALYIFNEKRNILSRLEEQYKQKITFVTENLLPYEYSINRVKSISLAKAVQQIEFAEPMLQIQAQDTEIAPIIAASAHKPPHPARHKEGEANPRRHRRDRRFENKMEQGEAQPSRPQQNERQNTPQTRRFPARKPYGQQGTPQQFFDLSTPGQDGDIAQASELLLTDEVVFQPVDFIPNNQSTSENLDPNNTDADKPKQNRERGHRDRNYLRRGARNRQQRNRENEPRQNLPFGQNDLTDLPSPIIDTTENQISEMPQNPVPHSEVFSPNQSIIENSEQTSSRSKPKRSGSRPQNQRTQNQDLQNEEPLNKEPVEPLLDSLSTPPALSEVNDPNSLGSNDSESRPHKSRDRSNSRNNRDSRGNRNSKGGRDSDRSSGRGDRGSRPPKPAGKVEIISAPIYHSEQMDVKTPTPSSTPAPNSPPSKLVEGAPEKPKKGWWSK